MNVKNLSQDFTRIIKVVGASPFIFLVYLPSVILIGFNVIFTSTVISLLIQTLDLASVIGKMVRGLMYLSTTLLIMKPLLEMLFTASNSELTTIEKKWLNLFDRLAMGILIFVALLFLGCWLGFIGKGNIMVDVCIPKPNLNSFESIIDIFYTLEVKDSSRAISFIEGVIIFICLGVIYFTDSAAGICLVTVKDILFPDLLSKANQSPHQAINDKKETEIINKFNDIYKTIEHYSIQSENDYNTVNGKLGNLKQYPHQVTSSSVREDMLSKVESIKKKLSDYKRKEEAPK